MFGPESEKGDVRVICRLRGASLSLSLTKQRLHVFINIKLVGLGQIYKTVIHLSLSQSLDRLAPEFIYLFCNLL